MGLGRLELPTSPLSEECSNRLSYRPACSSLFKVQTARNHGQSSVLTNEEETGETQGLACRLLGVSTRALSPKFPRKEVIQPQLPLRLPCYDFVPVTSPTFGGGLLAVSPPTSGVASSHDVTGGVYKARERIHRTVADARLLATPTSCRRVAACNPN